MATAPEPQGGYNTKAHVPQTFAEGLQDGSGLSDAQKNSLFAALISSSQGLTTLLNWLGASAVPVCQKISFTKAQIVALGAVTSGDLLAILLPARAIVLSTTVKHSAALVGPSISAATARLISANNNYGTAFDVFQAAGAEVFDFYGITKSENMATATSLNLHVTSTGANLSVLTAGAIDCWVTYLVRP